MVDDHTRECIGQLTDVSITGLRMARFLFVTDDCEYHASVGPEPGERFIGKDEVRRGFQTLLAHDEGSESLSGKLYVHGDRGVAEWYYKSTDQAGRSTVVRGCDLFEFVGDKISLKNAFRKCSA